MVIGTIGCGFVVGYIGNVFKQKIRFYYQWELDLVL